VVSAAESNLARLLVSFMLPYEPSSGLPCTALSIPSEETLFPATRAARGGTNTYAFGARADYSETDNSPVYICNTRLFKYLFLKTKSFSWYPQKKSISGKMHCKFARERLMAAVTIMKAMLRVGIHSGQKASAALHDRPAAFVPSPLPAPFARDH
jgi:hypothetical protein